jgi:hypothetical protein
MTTHNPYRSFTSLAMMVIVLSFGCLTQGGCSSIRSTGAGSEADHMASEFVEKTFSHCGDSYLGNIPGLFPKIPRLVEIKGFSVTVRSINIQEADRLNGYEWKGEILIRCSSSRDLSISGNSGKWYSGFGDGVLNVVIHPEIGVPLSKRNGQWFFYGEAAPDRTIQTGSSSLDIDRANHLHGNMQNAASYNPKRISCSDAKTSIP